MDNNRELFDFLDYREYLQYRLDNLGGRGQRSALAKHIGSPVSHISQVLGGVSHLSLEQGESANEFLQHTEIESDFFLLLIQFTRAGSQSLKKRLATQIKHQLEKRLIIKNRIDVKDTISEKDQLVFYSSWIYQAIHILVTIPHYQTRQLIASRLGISTKKTTEVLEFLVSLGLVQEENGTFKASIKRIHLGSDSSLVTKHHTNWRLRALHSMEQEHNNENLHYSSVISISREDFIKIKNLNIQHIQKIKKIIKASPEEELYSFSIDCFKV